MTNVILSEVDLVITLEFIHSTWTLVFSVHMALFTQITYPARWRLYDMIFIEFRSDYTVYKSANFLTVGRSGYIKYKFSFTLLRYFSLNRKKDYGILSVQNITTNKRIMHMVAEQHYCLLQMLQNILTT
jgi:hypothetical protein